jgi:tryptophan-rich sensory protein
MHMKTSRQKERQQEIHSPIKQKQSSWDNPKWSSFDMTCSSIIWKMAYLSTWKVSKLVYENKSTRRKTAGNSLPNKTKTIILK